jgi:hypothetical protein
MGFGIRFRLGPFSSYQRLGRTQAQKRAAAKNRAARLKERDRRRAVMITRGVVTGSGQGRLMIRSIGQHGDYVSMSRSDGHTLTLVTDLTFPVGSAVEVRERVRDDKLLSIRLSESASEAIAARKAREEQHAAARADHDSRTHRAVISGCKIDPLKGGSFTLSTGDDLSMVFNVAANAALHFLPLKNGDVVQVTLNPARTGLEEFWQLSRASGAKPRSAVELSAADMEWLGLTTEPSQPRPDAEP